MFFTLLGAFQLIWAAAVWTVRCRRLFILGALANAGAIALWAVTHTVGLPFGPDVGEPESVGIIDLLCVLAEAVVPAAAAKALWGSVRRRRS